MTIYWGKPQFLKFRQVQFFNIWTLALETGNNQMEDERRLASNEGRARIRYNPQPSGNYISNIVESRTGMKDLEKVVWPLLSARWRSEEDVPASVSEDEARYDGKELWRSY